MPFSKKKDKTDEAGNEATGLSKVEFAQLAKKHPNAVDRIEELDAAGKSFTEADNALLTEALAAKDSEHEKALKAKDEAHAEAIKAAEDKVTAAAAKAQEDADTITALEAKVKGFKNVETSRTETADPGSNASAQGGLGAEASEARIKQEWEAMSKDTQANYGTFESYQYLRQSGEAKGTDTDA